MFNLNENNRFVMAQHPSDMRIGVNGMCGQVRSDVVSTDYGLRSLSLTDPRFRQSLVGLGSEDGTFDYLDPYLGRLAVKYSCDVLAYDVVLVCVHIPSCRNNSWIKSHC